VVPSSCVLVNPVTAAHRKACATARSAVADLPLDAVVTGHRSDSAAPYPAWSAVDVTGLFEEDALVEMSCVARVLE
jgi:enamine deaminase RidA (YjgF/YER057c/UK114 family)